MQSKWADAIHQSKIGTLSAMCAEGADINSLDSYGQTGLMLAAKAGDAEVVRWMIEHHANLDHTAKYGLSAVMLAVINGHVETVSELVSAGADLGLTGSGAPGFQDKTVLDLALERGDQLVIDILEAASNHGKQT